MIDSYVILFVDDDINRQAARRVVRAAGLNAEIVEATDCATALKLLSNRHFDCVFLDFQLPDGGGPALLEAVHDKGIDTPIVMLTEHGDEQVAVELIKAGAADYLVKSRLTPETLVQSLRHAIRTHKAERCARETERQLQESERLVRELADTAPVLLWMSDAEGECTFFNQGWLEFTGRAMVQELGTGWEDLVHPEDRAGCVQLFADARASKQVFRMEYRLRRADGQYRWMLDTGRPRLSANGALIGYIGSCIDITERKQTEQALLEKQASIETLNARLRQAMFETHHRVKNNLQIIAAMIDMQIMDNPEWIATTDLKQFANHIHILAAVQDLLTRQAKIDGQANHISVESVLSVLLPMLQKSAGSCKLSFDIEDIDLPANQGISLALIANELIFNGLKHCKTIVHMSLTLQNQQNRRDGHDGLAGQDGQGGQDGQERHIVLEVTDDGPGFPSDFDRVHSAKMGLELVQNLSRLDLHGETRFETRAEGGGRVRVLVPLAS